MSRRPCGRGVGEWGPSPVEEPSTGRVWNFVGFEFSAKAKKPFQVWLHPKYRMEGTVFIGHSRDSSRHVHMHEMPASGNKMSKVAS